MLKYLALVCAAGAFAANMEVGLRGKIQQSLEEAIAAEARGVENCQNKCSKAFNFLAYATSETGTDTYEFDACVMGCARCDADLNNTAVSHSDCFDYCKNYPWTANSILKGVIEPDKACIAGCVIETCQVICQGGTVGPELPSTMKYFWPHSGCAIKTEPYSQYLAYVPFNSPNSLAGGNEATAQCCANAFSLCDYVGSTSSTNYADLLKKTQGFCSTFVPSGTVTDICNFFANPANCGQVVVG